VQSDLDTTPRDSGTLSRTSSIQRRPSKDSISTSSFKPTTPTQHRSGLPRAGPAATMHTSRSGLLPSIAGSPATQNKTKAASPSPSTTQTHARTMLSSTPTKIPRMASRTSLVNSVGVSGQAPPLPAKSAINHSLPVTRERTVTGPAAVSSSMLSEFGYGQPDKSRVGSRLYAKNGTAELPRADQSPTSISSQGTILASRGSVDTGASSSKRNLPVLPDGSDPNKTLKAKVLPRDLSGGSLRRTSLTSQSNGPTASPIATPSKMDKVPNRLAVPSYARIPHSSSTSNMSGRSSRSQSPQTSTVDEDEHKGNEEMAQFFKRQRSKQARGEIKSPEIEAMLNFPDDMEPGKELSPHGKTSTDDNRTEQRERLLTITCDSVCSFHQVSLRVLVPSRTSGNFGLPIDLVFWTKRQEKSGHTRIYSQQSRLRRRKGRLHSHPGRSSGLSIRDHVPSRKRFLRSGAPVPRSQNGAMRRNQNHSEQETVPFSGTR
jgi:dual specificity tyrosine-phosphorylation-regulated kinase 2/3/4